MWSLCCVLPSYLQPCTEENAYNNSRQSSSSSSQSENAVFGMPLEVAVALTKIDADDLIPAVFRRCIEYLDHVGRGIMARRLSVAFMLKKNAPFFFSSLRYTRSWIV